MNRLILYWKFDLYYKYAIILVQIAIACLYWSGMPILVPLLCVTFFIHYVCEKKLIIRYYTKIP